MAAMVVALACLITVAGSGLSDSKVEAAKRVVRVPSSIDYRGRRDVSAQLQRFINRVPDNRRILFRAGGVYRLRHGIRLINRRELVFDGNGATLRAIGNPSAPGDSAFALMHGDRRITIRDFKLVGSNSNAGTTRAYGRGEHLHGFYIGGASDILIEDVTVRNFFGDCFYIGTNSGTTWSSRITIQDSTCDGTGRHGVGMIAGRNITVQRVRFDRIGLWVVDMEPDRRVEGTIGFRFRRNRIGTFGHTDRWLGWVVAAFGGARGAAIRNVSIVGNTITGNPRPGYDRVPVGMAIIVDGNLGPRSNWVIKNNKSTITVRRSGHGHPIYMKNVSGVTVTGNRQPMTSGAYAQFPGSSKVVNRNNSTRR
jgi:hypothetical protein